MTLKFDSLKYLNELYCLIDKDEKNYDNTLEVDLAQFAQEHDVKRAYLYRCMEYLAEKDLIRMTDKAYTSESVAAEHGDVKTIHITAVGIDLVE